MHLGFMTRLEGLAKIHGSVETNPLTLLFMLVGACSLWEVNRRNRVSSPAKNLQASTLRPVHLIPEGC